MLGLDRVDSLASHPPRGPRRADARGVRQRGYAAGSREASDLHLEQPDGPATHDGDPVAGTDRTAGCRRAGLPAAAPGVAPAHPGSCPGPGTAGVWATPSGRADRHRWRPVPRTPRSDTGSPSPSRQYRQRPHGWAGSMATRSPRRGPAAMVPPISCPGTIGSSIPIDPMPPSRNQCRSEPQMPTASTRTSDSPGPGTGSGSCVSRRSRAAWSRTVRVVDTCRWYALRQSFADRRSWPSAPIRRNAPSQARNLRARPTSFGSLGDVRGPRPRPVTEPIPDRHPHHGPRPVRSRDMADGIFKDYTPQGFCEVFGADGAGRADRDWRVATHRNPITRRWSLDSRPSEPRSWPHAPTSWARSCAARASPSTCTATRTAPSGPGRSTSCRASSPPTSGTTSSAASPSGYESWTCSSTTCTWASGPRCGTGSCPAWLVESSPGYVREAIGIRVPGRPLRGLGHRPGARHRGHLPGAGGQPARPVRRGVRAGEPGGHDTRR